MNLNRSLALIGSSTALMAAGCATSRPQPAVTPNYSPIVGQSITVNGELYAGCIREATLAKHYNVTADGATKMLRFECTGEAARHLYEALAKWSISQRSEWISEGRTWRSTQRIKKDLFGADYCSTGGASDFRCDIVLNVGDFLMG